VEGQAWSWVLGSLGVVALFSIGKHKWWGWLIAFVNECLWFTYGTVTGQWGFVFAAICYGAVNFYHGRRWMNDTRTN
jgi:hypothetical protein